MPHFQTQLSSLESFSKGIWPGSFKFNATGLSRWAINKKHRSQLTAEQLSSLRPDRWWSLTTKNHHLQGLGWSVAKTHFFVISWFTKFTIIFQIHIHESIFLGCTPLTNHFFTPKFTTLRQNTWSKPLWLQDGALQPCRLGISEALPVLP